VSGNSTDTTAWQTYECRKRILKEFCKIMHMREGGHWISTVIDGPDGAQTQVQWPEGGQADEAALGNGSSTI
jgi:hypothetical protein